MTGPYSKEYMDSHAAFEPISIEHHRLVPQDAVKAYVFPKEDRHNAIWDYFKTATGHHYFSNCAEGNFTETFELCEYFPKT
ncbi:MAG: hypothetical protein LBC62_00045, partial [Treponema sp.]|nr:hypothetical protein [Treponema sp.]